MVPGTREPRRLCPSRCHQPPPQLPEPEPLADHKLKEKRFCARPGMAARENSCHHKLRSHPLLALGWNSERTRAPRNSPGAQLPAVWGEGGAVTSRQHVPRRHNSCIVDLPGQLCRPQTRTISPSPGASPIPWQHRRWHRVVRKSTYSFPPLSVQCKPALSSPQGQPFFCCREKQGRENTYSEWAWTP